MPSPTTPCSRAELGVWVTSPRPPRLGVGVRSIASPPRVCSGAVRRPPPARHCAARMCQSAIVYALNEDLIDRFEGDGHRSVSGPHATGGIFATYPGIRGTTWDTCFWQTVRPFAHTLTLTRDLPGLQDQGPLSSSPYNPRCATPAVRERTQGKRKMAPTGRDFNPQRQGRFPKFAWILCPDLFDFSHPVHKAVSAVLRWVWIGEAQ